MLTAKEARAMMPDKETIIHDNVESICNDIQQAAQEGCSSISFNRGIYYFKETMDKLKELGYTVKREDYIWYIEWYEHTFGGYNVHRRY